MTANAPVKIPKRFNELAYRAAPAGKPEQASSEHSVGQSVREAVYGIAAVDIHKNDDGAIRLHVMVDDGGKSSRGAAIVKQA